MYFESPSLWIYLKDIGLLHKFMWVMSDVCRVGGVRCDGWGGSLGAGRGMVSGGGVMMMSS